MKILLCLCFTLCTINYAVGKHNLSIIKINKQKCFKKNIPPGNYSAIAFLGKNHYAVVSDKSKTRGFFIFSIDIDSITGEVKNAKNIGFKGEDNNIAADLEGIAYAKNAQKIYLASEADNTIREYTLQGKYTGKYVSLNNIIPNTTPNYGLESLTYNNNTNTFWTCNESTAKADGQQANSTNGIQNKIRIIALDNTLKPILQYAYLMDKPLAHTKAQIYAMGVSELLALEQGKLLVLEREIFVPKGKIGAWTNNKIYLVDTMNSKQMTIGENIKPNAPFLKKYLIYEWKTKINLLTHNFANYEGMCLGPKLSSGAHVVILISDSQNQAYGVLNDWIKTIIIK